MIPATIAGYSLIELIIYSGLVTIIVGAFLSTAYFFITTSQRDRERHAVVENEVFLQEKLQRLLYGATATQITPSSGTAAFLDIKRSCTDYVKIDLVASAVRFGKNSDGDCDVDSQDQHANLTNSHVQASALQVSRLTTNGQAAIRVQVILQGKYESKSIDKTVYVP